MECGHRVAAALLVFFNISITSSKLAMKLVPLLLRQISLFNGLNLYFSFMAPLTQPLIASIDGYKLGTATAHVVCDSAKATDVDVNAHRLFERRLQLMREIFFSPSLFVTTGVVYKQVNPERNHGNNSCHLQTAGGNALCAGLRNSRLW